MNGRGNPGVYLLYPYLYPPKPLPLSQGVGVLGGKGKGYEGYEGYRNPWGFL